MTAPPPEPPPPRTRRPRSVYEVGQEPDPRFSLANERTALAWMRTAVALIGGGIALISLADVDALPRWATVLGLVAALGGAGVALRAARSWAHIERALRLGQPLPPPNGLFVVAAAVVIVAVAVVGLAVSGLLGG